MYFIMGLPTETDEDVVGIIETGRSVRAVGRQVAREQGHGRAPQVTVSVSQHVPKPHTPFQWAAMDAMEDLESKVRMLRTLAKDAKIGIKTHDVRESWLECLFARGDRRMGDVLLTAYRAGARFDGWREGFDFRRWLDALEAHGIRPEVFTRTLPVGARLPWDHLDIGLEPGFLEGEYRKALASRVSPPCGKPAGAKVHHGTVAAAEAEARRLVCYDCGIACDMTAMREERIVALRSLSDLTQARMDAQVRDEAAAEARAQARTQAEAAGLVSADRLRSLTARSKLADGAARKAAAEAPHSRLRLFFAKTGTLRFLGHRDLLRVLPRMFRRAGIELAFSRGFNPIPRMTFAPALPLGVAADQEVADVDVLLDGVSDRDLSGAMSDAEREAVAAELVARLAAVAPPGMRITAGRLVAPGEHKLGELIVAADWAVRLEPHQLARAQAAVALAPAARSWVVERQLHAKGKGRGRRPDGPQTRAVDVAQVIEHPRVVGEHLLFRMRLDGEGGARPREVVQALIGEPAPDHAFTRTRLLARHADGLVAMADLGPAWRPTPPPRPRATFADGPAPAAE